ncbi:site-specific recombination directionality factor RDF [Klebsiella phage phi1_175008]|uniref:Site-specific recombination directionality factor RDF n=2 Tax=Klebsiella phage phi1_175008 TaxID=3127744 RepID=A0ACD5FRU2_9CAUD
MKKQSIFNTTVGLLTIALATVSLIGCEQAADVASRNIANAGDNFEVLRSTHFINTRTDKELMRIEGYCAKDNSSTDRTLIITCRDKANGSVKKHYMGLSTDTTYFIEQVDGAQVSVDHTRVIFAPQTLIPSLEVR